MLGMSSVVLVVKWPFFGVSLGDLKCVGGC